MSRWSVHARWKRAPNPRHAASRRHCTPGELLAFMDGELPEAEATACAAHLESCWSCRAERDDIARTIECVVRLGNWSLQQELPPPPGARPRFLLALAAHRAEVVGRGSSRAVVLASMLLQPNRLTALGLCAVLVVTAALLWRRPPTKLSAAEVLRRADARIAALVKPGQVFHRRWASTLTVDSPSGGRSVIERVSAEWAEGSMPNRLAARTEDPSGRLVEAAWTVPENGERRLFYFNAGDHQLGDPAFPAHAATGAVFRWPTRSEVARELLAHFPESRRTLLQFAFDFALMEPVVMEHRFPAAAEHFATRFSTDKTTYGTGQPAISITMHLPRAAVFDLGEGRFKALVGAWQGTYVYDASSCLLQSFDGTWVGRDGVRARYQLRLEQSDVHPVANEPFAFEAPPGTQATSLSTGEILAEIDRAFLEDTHPRPPPTAPDSSAGRTPKR